jgi:hypothetical protein
MYLQLYGPQFVAGPGALQTQAETLATGLGGYQPYLQAAQAATGPTSISTIYVSVSTRCYWIQLYREYDVQAQRGLPGLSCTSK